MISKGEVIESGGDLRSIRETILRMVGEPSERGLTINAYDTEDWSLIDWVTKTNLNCSSTRRVGLPWSIFDTTRSSHSTQLGHTKTFLLMFVRMVNCTDRRTQQ